MNTMNNKVLVVQLGKTGMSLVRHFSNCGCAVDVVDVRENPPELINMQNEYPQIKLQKLDSYLDIDPILNEKYDDIIVSPGVEPSQLNPSLRIKSDLDCFIDLFHARWTNKELRPKLIAITGTNGKSTTCNLVTKLLVANNLNVEVVGNIGIPLLDAFQDWQANDWPEIIVLEVSSFQLARLHKNLDADVACLLNCAPDHLNWHGNLNDYYLAKEKVYLGAKLAVFNHNDQHSVAGAKEAETQVGFGELSSVNSNEWAVNSSRIVQKDNEENYLEITKLVNNGIMPQSACAAITIFANLLPKLEIEQLITKLENFAGLQHRFELIKTVNNIEFINDSKATNVAATIKALKTINDKCILIAGGEEKEQDFSPLISVIASVVSDVLIIGENPKKFIDTVKRTDVNFHIIANMNEAVNKALLLAQEKNIKTVLMSPACSSLDQYQNFEERGMAFINAVNNLNGVNSAAA